MLRHVNGKYRNWLLLGGTVVIILFFWESTNRTHRQKVFENIYTTVRCSGDCCAPTYQNRSCVWHNLYFHGGKFYALMNNFGPQNKSQYATLIMNRNPIATATNLSGLVDSAQNQTYYWKASEPFFPEALNVNDHDAVSAILYNLEIKEGLHIFYHRFFPQNWGHGVLDDLLPAFHAMLQLGFSASSPFRSLLWSQKGASGPSDDGRQGWSSEEVLEAFGGKKMEWPLVDWSKSRWIRIETLIVGTSQKGQRCMTQNYEIPGVELDLLRLFRDRVYRGFGMPPPDSRTSSMQGRAEGGSKLKIFLIKNKRNLGDLDEHAKQIRAAIPNTHVRVLDYEQYPSFKKQLQLFWSLDVYITGPGTAITPSFLLPDGGVVVNLGGLTDHFVAWNNSALSNNSLVSRTSVDFMEEYIGMFFQVGGRGL